MDLARDDDGHLAYTADWCADAARQLSAEAGVRLQPDHWRVIHILRTFHHQTGVSPSMRALVNLMRDQGVADLASSIALLRLFPGKPRSAGSQGQRLAAAGQVPMTARR